MREKPVSSSSSRKSSQLGCHEGTQQPVFLLVSHSICNSLRRCNCEWISLRAFSHLKGFLVLATVVRIRRRKGKKSGNVCTQCTRIKSNQNWKLAFKLKFQDLSCQKTTEEDMDSVVDSTVDSAEEREVISEEKAATTGKDMCTLVNKSLLECTWTRK